MDLKQAALDYHSLPTPGKISVELTTAAETQGDLALAYSPGIAVPRNCQGSGSGLSLYRQRESGCGYHQWHRFAGPGESGRVGKQACHGRQGAIVQTIRGD